MTKFNFLTKFKYAIGILGMTLFLIFAACVKEVVHNQSQFEAEKAELLKAKAEMTTSFKSMATALQATGKKYFGTPHNGKNSVDKEAFFRDLTAEMSRQNLNTRPNPALRAKVWDAKTESLRDYMSANGASENVIAYSNTLKENLETASKKYSDKVDAGELDVNGMVASLTAVFQEVETEVINDRNLTQSEKLTLLASTTAGIELTAPLADLLKDVYFNVINRAEGWRWLRQLGNAIVTVIVVVLVVAVIVLAIVAAVETGGLSVVLAEGLLSGLFAGSGVGLGVAIWNCDGLCVFPDDGCFCQ
jgi:hypothetical protein